MSGQHEDWWTLQHAADTTGLHQETIGNWARKGRVDSEEFFVGKRRRVRVKPEDVFRESALNEASGTVRSTLPAGAGLVAPTKEMYGDRVSVFEEVARRYRTIEEHREEIERHHRDIERTHREIEDLLQGSSHDASSEASSAS
jgi:hypothetical protein